MTGISLLLKLLLCCSPYRRENHQHRDLFGQIVHEDVFMAMFIPRGKILELLQHMIHLELK